MHEIHVRRARADVLGGDVTPAEALDKTSVRAEQKLTTRRLIVANDDGLAAAQIETGNGVLVGHAPRQTQRIDDRVVIAGVAPESRTA